MSNTLIGAIQDVSGNSIRVALKDDTITGFIVLDGEGYFVGQVGGFIRIPMGFVDLYGIITQVGAGAVPDQKKEENPFGNRWISVQLVGESRHGGVFQRGISQYPTIDDAVHFVTISDLKKVYGPGEPDDFVRIGSLASAESIPALVNINKLVTRHSAILGSTGSGKSTTVAGLLRALSDSEKYPASRILVFDIHGEYSRALKKRATVFKVSPSESDTDSRTLHIPYWALNCEELIKICFGTLDSKDYVIFQDRILAEKQKYFKSHPIQGLTKERVSADTPIPFSIHQLWYDLFCENFSTHFERSDEPQGRSTWALEKNEQGEELLGDAISVIPPSFRPIKDVKGDSEKIRLSKTSSVTRRPIDILASKLRDPRFDFLFSPGSWKPESDGTTTYDLDVLLQEWLGSTNPITILDLSGIPTSILTDLIGALLRIVYDSLFWARNIPEGGRERPLLAVLEEAHLYLSRESSGFASSIVKRIAKEGRKYGVGLMVVSQRPSEIDPTILSQCGSLFSLRLSNESDRGQVTSAASDNLKGLFEMLPNLRTGEAIVIGEAVSLPMRALIQAPPLDERPDSQDPVVTVKFTESDGFYSPGGWNQNRDSENYAIVLSQWRAQDPNYRHLKRPTQHENGASDGMD